VREKNNEREAKITIRRKSNNKKEKNNEKETNITKSGQK